MGARFIIGDVYEVLRGIPDDSVDLILTSPPREPFLALRSYLPADHPDKHKEIGSEATPADFLDTLLALTEEWGRVLAPHGSICVELGDTYSGNGESGWERDKGEYRRETRSAVSAAGFLQGKRTPNGWPLDKSLTLTPSLYAASLAYGRNLLNPDHTFEPWRVRNLVAWCRSNPPVGALGDKVRPATSYLTWATRARDRWFDLDAVRTPFTGVNADKQADGWQVSERAAKGYADASPTGKGRYGASEQRAYGNPAGGPPLDWWKISPNGYAGAHYATFPEELCRIPIEASCPRRVCRSCGKPSRREIRGERIAERVEGRRKIDVVNSGFSDHAPGDGWQYDRTTTGWSSCGCPGTDGIRLDGYHTGTGWRPGHVLDPFGGSGTTAVVATGRGRDCTLIDLDVRNAQLARERLGMFLEVDDPTTEGAA